MIIVHLMKTAAATVDNVVKAVRRTYWLSVVFGFLGVFIVVGFLPPLVSDYFGLAGLENIRGVVFSLLSVSIALSSISITFIILVHNFYFKSLRRNAIAVVFKSTWVKLIVSVATGITIFIFSAWVTINDDLSGPDITRVYLSGAFVFGMLLLQLPLLTVVMQDSLSLRTIQKLTLEIDNDAISRFKNPRTPVDEPYAIVEEFEDNPLIQLRDFAVEAARGRDWTIPQTVIGHCYNALIEPIAASSEENDVSLRIFAWCHLCERVGIASIESDHSRNLDVVISALFRTSIHLCDLQSYEHHRQVAECLTVLMSAILRRDGYDAFKEKAVETFLDYIAVHLERVRLTDEEWPTPRFTERTPRPAGTRSNGHESAHSYWFFLTDTLVNHFKSILELAIKANPEISERSIEWPIGRRFSLVLDEKGLTRHQQDNFLFRIYLDTSYLLRARTNQGATKSGLFFVETLCKIVVDQRSIFRVVLSDFFRHLHAKGEGDSFAASMRRHDLFQLGQRIAEKEPVNETMIGCMDAIIYEGIKYASEEADSGQPEGAPFSSSIRYELKRLFDALESRQEYQGILAKDKARILKLTQGVES